MDCERPLEGSLSKIRILYAQLQGLADAKAGPIEQLRQQRASTTQPAQYLADCVPS